MTPMSDPYRRLSKKAEQGRGATITAADVDLLVLSGVLGALQEASTKELERIVEERQTGQK